MICDLRTNWSKLSWPSNMPFGKHTESKSGSGPEINEKAGYGSEKKIFWDPKH